MNAWLLVKPWHIFVPWQSVNNTFLEILSKTCHIIERSLHVRFYRLNKNNDMQSDLYTLCVYADLWFYVVLTNWRQFFMHLSNIVTKFNAKNRTDAWKTDVNFFWLSQKIVKLSAFARRRPTWIKSSCVIPLIDHDKLANERTRISAVVVKVSIACMFNCKLLIKDYLGSIIIE